MHIIFSNQVAHLEQGDRDGNRSEEKRELSYVRSGPGAWECNLCARTGPPLPRGPWFAKQYYRSRLSCKLGVQLAQLHVPINQPIRWGGLLGCARDTQGSSCLITRSLIPVQSFVPSRCKKASRSRLRLHLFCVCDSSSATPKQKLSTRRQQLSPGERFEFGKWWNPFSIG